MVNYQDALDPLMVPIDTIKQNPENYNSGDVEMIVESIVTNGMYRPVYVSRETNEIAAGNHTYEACLSLGAEVIPVVWLDGNSTDMIRTMLVDNKIASLARPDIGQELMLLERLAAEDSLVGTGYREYDLEVLRALNEIPLDLDNDHGSWPTLCFTIHPQTKKRFMEITQAAGGDNERFALLVELASQR